jgi:hypothetical protein
MYPGITVREFRPLYLTCHCPFLEGRKTCPTNISKRLCALLAYTQNLIFIFHVSKASLVHTFSTFQNFELLNLISTIPDYIINFELDTFIILATLVK